MLSAFTTDSEILAFRELVKWTGMSKGTCFRCFRARWARVWRAAAAPEITRRLLGTGSPEIAIDIPHPGTTEFGANNYEAGLIRGRHLGRWSKKTGRVPAARPDPRVDGRDARNGA